MHCAGHPQVLFNAGGAVNQSRKRKTAVKGGALKTIFLPLANYQPISPLSLDTEVNLWAACNYRHAIQRMNLLSSGAGHFLDIVTQKYSSINFATLDTGLSKMSGKSVMLNPNLIQSRLNSSK